MRGIFPLEHPTGLFVTKAQKNIRRVTASSQPNFGSPSPLEPSSEEEEEEEDLFVFNDTMEGPRAGIHFKVYSRVSHRGGHVLLAPTEVGEYKGGRGRHRK
jgi:hypothetical protein